MSKAEHVEARMAMAHDKLELARRIIKDGFYRDVISKAYYAMFYASKALLLELGEDPHKHKGVVSLFDERIAKIGLSAPKYGALLSDYLKLRIDADYEDEFRATKEKAEDAISKADDFVAEAKKILARIRAREEKK